MSFSEGGWERFVAVIFDFRAAPGLVFRGFFNI
jgi:hypothetical protein